ncbi:MAG: N-acetyltransferase [Streptosporangiaceae bacterium]|nr:N-acetyltransferase [Streptosporangiaceae bacterium]MBV9857373.1 N-acetyltransferase [Streptosporangiaceae bacterium]
MPLVREIGPDDWPLLRDIRLAALREAPQAFASAYEREAAFGETDWRRRVASGATFFGYLPGGPGGSPGTGDASPAGLSTGLEEDPDTAELVSMWVRPQARGHGVGEALVSAVTAWAADRGFAAVHLWVSEVNLPARRLYERCGFKLTGERQPLPSDPRLPEVGMRCAL